MQMRKYRILATIGLVAAVIAVLGAGMSMTGYLIGTSDMYEAFPPSINISSSVAPATKIDGKTYAMAIGEESTVTADFTARNKYSDNVTLTVVLPAGLHRVRGDLSTQKDIAPNETATMKIGISAVKVGRWPISVKVSRHKFNQTYEEESIIEICISVIRDDAIKMCSEKR